MIVSTSRILWAMGIAPFVLVVSTGKPIPQETITVFVVIPIPIIGTLKSQDTMKVIPALLCFFALVGQSRADDQQLTDYLTGDWWWTTIANSFDGTPTKFLDTFTYYSNGQFQETKMVAGKGAVTIQAMGTWSVQNGALLVAYTSVNPWSFAPLFRPSTTPIEVTGQDTWTLQGTGLTIRRGHP